MDDLHPKCVEVLIYVDGAGRTVPPAELRAALGDDAENAAETCRLRGLFGMTSAGYLLKDPGRLIVVERRLTKKSSGDVCDDPIGVSHEPVPAHEPPMRQLVTLDQCAAVLQFTTKRALEGWPNRPEPDVKGVGGKPNQWDWPRIRPWLEQHSDRRLPKLFSGRIG